MTYEHLKTEIIKLGGGSQARVVYLGDNIENKKVAVINRYDIALYDSIDDFWHDFDHAMYHPPEDEIKRIDIMSAQNYN